MSRKYNAIATEFANVLIELKQLHHSSKPIVQSAAYNGAWAAIDTYIKIERRLNSRFDGECFKQFIVSTILREHAAFHDTISNA